MRYVSRFMLMVVTLCLLPGYAVAVESSYLESQKKAAEQGDAMAQFKLADTYFSGRGGVPADESQAAVWYHKAADQGLALAQFKLGFMYFEGRGVPKDEVQAAKWYRKAAEQGYRKAQNELGHMYYYGRGVAQDYVKAVEWYRKAAEQGYNHTRLGHMYAEGLGVPQDDDQAVAWYLKGLEKANEDSMYVLGTMYYHGTPSNAMHNYINGKNAHTDNDVRKDYAKAAIWTRKAAERGYAPAQFRLAHMYADGLGVPQDEAQAEAWHNKGCALSRESSDRTIVNSGRAHQCDRNTPCLKHLR